MWAARLDGAAAQLRRILGPEPDGAAWVTERLLRSADDLPLAGRALFAGQRSQAVPDEQIARLWRSTDRHQLGAAEDRLATRGLLGASGLTDRGRKEREQIEAATDAAMTIALDVLGNDIDQILTTLEPWGAAIRAAGGYLTPPAATSPRWCGSPFPHRDDPRPSVGAGLPRRDPTPRDVSGLARCAGDASQQ